MTMRHLLAVLCSVQLCFAPIAYAAETATSQPTGDMPDTPAPPPDQKATTTGQDILNGVQGQKGPDAPPGTPAANPPAPTADKAQDLFLTGNYKQTAKCYNSWMKEPKDQLVLTFVDLRDQEGMDRIEDQLQKNKNFGCGAVGKAASSRAFREGLLDLFNDRLTEGRPGFDRNAYNSYKSNLARLVDSGKAIGECAGQPGGCAPPIGTDPLPTGPALPPARPPAAVVVAPTQAEPEEVVESRPSTYHRPHHHHDDDDDDNDNGGNHSFMNSNLLWGVGGLAIGGILGYMIGKNSQPQYQFPYYGQMGPGGMYPLQRPMGPLGQVPGGAYSPYGFGYNTGGLPGAYQLPGGYGLGGNTNFSPIYNGGGIGGRPPQVLPFYH